MVKDKNKVLLLISSILMFGYMITGLIVINLFNQKIDKATIILFLMYSLGSIIFLFYSFSEKKINRILLFLISLLLFIGNVISGILGFVYFSKTRPKIKRDLPKLEILNNYNKLLYILIFLISMGLIFIVPLFIDNKVLHYSLEALIVLVLAIVFRKDLKRDFKYFREYFSEYSSYVFKMYLISLAFMLISNVSIRLYTGLENATNQLELNKTFMINPILVIVLAVIVAPLMEELLFRGIFRKIFNNKYAFIIISSIIFGALHVIDDFKTPKELLFILSYSILGIFLGTIYEKTNNIFANMMFHFIQNLLAILAMILKIFFM